MNALTYHHEYTNLPNSQICISSESYYFTAQLIFKWDHRHDDIKYLSSLCESR